MAGITRRPIDKRMQKASLPAMPIHGVECTSIDAIPFAILKRLVNPLHFLYIQRDHREQGASLAVKASRP